MVAYLKASLHEKTYSDYLQAARKVEKKESMELSQNPCSQMIDKTAKPKSTSFFPLWKLKGNQLVFKMATVHLAHLKEESTEREEVDESEDPDGIDRVTEEFMVHLAQVMKDAQVEEKCCYHCSSPKHFIQDCPLVRVSKREYTVKLQGGDSIEEGSPDPSDENDNVQEPQGGGSQGITWPKQTPFLNQDPFQHWHRVENVAKVKINGESCVALLDNGAQINTIMPNYVKNHSLEMGLITDLIGSRVTCMGLGNAYTHPLGYIIVWVQVDRVQGYNEDQITLVVPDESKFAEQVPIMVGIPTISHVMNVMKEREIDALGKCHGGTSIILASSHSHSVGKPNLRKCESKWVQ